jgi:hypothetical protein
MSAEHPTTEDGLLHAVVTAVSPQHTSAKVSDCSFCDNCYARPNLPNPEPTPQGKQASHELSVPIDFYQRHLSRHMEQLALFAVPPAGDDDDDDDDDDEASEDYMNPDVDEADDEDDEDDNDDDEDDNDDDDDVEQSSQEAEDSIDLSRHMDAIKADHELITRYAPKSPGRTNEPETVERRLDGDDIVEVIEEHSSVSVAPPSRRKSKRATSAYSSVSDFQPSPQPVPGGEPPIVNENIYWTDSLGGVHDDEPYADPPGYVRQGDHYVPISSAGPDSPPLDPSEKSPSTDQDPSHVPLYDLIPTGQSNRSRGCRAEDHAPRSESLFGATEKDARGPLPDPRSSNDDKHESEKKRIIGDYEHKQREAMVRSKAEEIRILERVERETREAKDEAKAEEIRVLERMEHSQKREVTEVKQQVIEDAKRERVEREKREAKEREEREWQQFLHRQKEKQVKEDLEKREAQAKLDEAMRKRLAEYGFTQSQIDDIMDKQKAKKQSEQPTPKSKPI